MKGWQHGVLIWLATTYLALILLAALVVIYQGLLWIFARLSL